jgi:hypothetical protein
VSIVPDAVHRRRRAGRGDRRRVDVPGTRRATGVRHDGVDGVAGADGDPAVPR